MSGKSARTNSAKNDVSDISIKGTPTNQDILEGMKFIRRMVEDSVKSFGKRKEQSLQSTRETIYEAYGGLFDIQALDDRLKRFLDREFVPQNVAKGK